MQIELDAFSGRPNPRWELAGAQEMEFERQLHALKKSQAGASVGDGLGYRGFVVRPTGDSGIFDEIRLFRGTAVIRRGDHSEILADPDRGLERWLLDSAQGHIEDSVLRYVGSDFAHSSQTNETSPGG